MKTTRLLILMVLALCMYGCAYDSEDDFVNSDYIENPDENDDNDDEAQVTYTEDIAQIMTTACTSCHGNPPTNGAPFALINFSQVSQRANGIFSRMDLPSGFPSAMPPSGRLPQSTIDLIEQWIEGGKPE